MTMQENRRRAFRVDDMLPMRDRPLSTQAFEDAKTKIGVRSRQHAMLRQMLGRDVFAELEQHPVVSEELAKALEVLDAKLNYLIGLHMLQDAAQGKLEERPVNLSATGCAFITDEMYRAGDPIEVVMMLPTFPPTILELIGEVAWAEQAPKGRWRVGVRFVFRSEEEEDALAKYVYRRHREWIRLNRGKARAAS